MRVKFKESTQWYKIFYVATAIATAVYSKNMTKNTYYFKHILTIIIKLLRDAQLDWYNYLGKTLPDLLS